MHTFTEAGGILCLHSAVLVLYIRLRLCDTEKAYLAGF